VPSALSISQVGVRIGMETFHVPSFVPLSALRRMQDETLDLQAVSAAEAIDASVRLHDYVAISGEIYGSTRVGSNTRTLLNAGADFSFGATGGLLVKIIQYKGFRLAVQGRFGFVTGNTANIAVLFNDLNTIASDAVSRLQDPSVSDPDPAGRLQQRFQAATADLLVPFSGLRYSGAVNMTQGIGPWFGVQGSLGLAGESTTYDETTFDSSSGKAVSGEMKITTVVPSVGVALDLDLRPIHVPADFMLEYILTPLSSTSESQNSDRTEHSLEQRIALGISYSGRPDFQLGLTVYTLLGQTPVLGADQQPSGTPTSFGARLGFRYFW
jgi:hypothetical protein